MPSALPKTIGIARGLERCIKPATMRICFSRPALAISAADSIVAAWSADPDFLDMRAMLRSIRFRQPVQNHRTL